MITCTLLYVIKRNNISAIVYQRTYHTKKSARAYKYVRRTILNHMLVTVEQVDGPQIFNVPVILVWLFHHIKHRRCRREALSHVYGFARAALVCRRHPRALWVSRTMMIHHILRRHFHVSLNLCPPEVLYLVVRSSRKMLRNLRPPTHNSNII